jgi:toxin ParE1/3/4
VKSIHKLQLTEDARADLRDIRRSTAQRWGVQQRDAYYAKLIKAMRSLLDYPELGPLRDDLYLGCRSLAAEQHVIFYRVIGDEIVVGRVLHGSQEPVGKVIP